ncbi:hypothetical protein IE53DRAFT_327380 [Violaceomyces palustris]|uniref:Uncharacterized protein n=1 Tax=Violaceomyces palustris TaxID=1673888 RepID=A0ACD0P217_9BASI|nr:hypothetical protein IE53DRAFT_327380 [Violaceomyces palustris]
MPKAEAGSVKAVSNAIKARGLTKLRFYCQICSKACRDANGYKCHIESEAHMRQIDVLGSSGNVNSVIDNFSQEFQKGFVQLLSRRFGTKRIKANQVYQEYIAERHHLHMNATKWTTLTDFVKDLGRQGVVHVDESEQGWFISWIDNSPAALARQDALQKMERGKMDDEQRQRKMLREQIERAEKLKADESASGPKVEEGLNREEGGAPLKLGISLAGLKKTTETGSASGSEPSSSSTPSQTKEKVAGESTSKPVFKLGVNPLKSMSKPSSTSAAGPKPFGGNALKSASSDSDKKRSKPPSSMTMAEKIMMEEQERKKRKVESGGGGGGVGVGPRMQPGLKRSRF